LTFEEVWTGTKEELMRYHFRKLIRGYYISLFVVILVNLTE